MTECSKSMLGLIVVFLTRKVPVQTLPEAHFLYKDLNTQAGSCKCTLFKKTGMATQMWALWVLNKHKCA